MNGYGFSKAALAILLTWIAACVSALCVFGVASLLFDMSSNVAGFALFLASAILCGWIAKTIANALLFDNANDVDFQVFCGTRNPGAGIRFITWPFAKLTATKSALRFQSVWNDFRWENDGTSPIIRQPTSLLGEFTISCDGLGPPVSTRFSVLPWRTKHVANALRTLGYNVP